MHRTHKSRVLVMVSSAKSLSVSVATMLNPTRLACLTHGVRKQLLLIKLNRRYAARFKQLDAQVEVLSIAFFGRHRDYFNLLASSRVPMVAERGDYLIELRYWCRIVITMLLLRNMMRRHVVAVKKIDAKEAERFAQVSAELDTMAKTLLDQLKVTDVPTHMLEVEYAAIS